MLSVKYASFFYDKKLCPFAQSFLFYKALKNCIFVQIIRFYGIFRQIPADCWGRHQ